MPGIFPELLDAEEDCRLGFRARPRRHTHGSDFESNAWAWPWHRCIKYSAIQALDSAALGEKELKLRSGDRTEEI